MEREFQQLSGFEQVKKLRTLLKFTGRFKQDMGELAYADLNSNFKFRGCLRPIWPQKSHISSFSFKYHIAIAFVHIWQLTGYFVIHLILLQRHGILQNGLQPQKRFEVREIVLGAIRWSLTKETSIQWTMTSHLPLLNNWLICRFCHLPEKCELLFIG